MTVDERRHADECAACRELVADRGDLGRELAEMIAPDAAPASDELRERVRSSLEAERRPTAWLKNLSTPGRLAVAMSLSASIIVLAGIAKPRADWSAYPKWRMALVLSLFAVSLGATLVELLRPLHVPAPAPRHPRMLATAGLGLPLVVSSLPAPVRDLSGAGNDFVRAALACFSYGSLLAVPVLAALFLLERRTTATRAVVLLTAAAGGLVGNLVLQVHCPITHPAHLLSGHATIGFGLAAVYALVARYQLSTGSHAK